MTEDVRVGTIKVGMSGFSYPEWIGEIYPQGTKRKDMLAAYATIFPVVEINMTFRRRPEAATMEKWRDLVPDGFTFAMKANQFITHYRRLVDAGEDIKEFVTTVRNLGDRLGPILFQLHPTTKFGDALVNDFAADLVPGFSYAIEPRHESWMSSEAYEVLGRNGIALCLNDDNFDLDKHAVTGSFAYFRFHREAPYSAEELERRAELLRRLRDSAVDVYAFFSHEDNPDSVKPALRFADLVG